MALGSDGHRLASLRDALRICPRTYIVVCASDDEAPAANYAHSAGFSIGPSIAMRWFCDAL
jgi:hypothetical protein